MQDKTVILGAVAARLDLIKPEGAEQGLDLMQDEVVLGRSQDCHLVLMDERVSRHHARLRREGAGHVIEDLGSANGVLINGVRVQRQLLAHGDVITLGPCELKYSLPTPPAGGTVVAGMPGPSQTHAPQQRKSKPAKSKPAPMPKPPSSGKGRKLVLMGGVAALLGVLLVGGLAMLGDKPTPKPPAQPAATAPVAQPMPSAPPAQAYTPQAPPPPQTYVPPPPSPQPPTAPAMRPPAPPAMAGQGQPAPPQGPPGAAPAGQATMYAEQGQIFFDAGRLPDAVAAWSKAVALDPGNNLVQVKLQKAKDELARRAEEAFNRGMRNFQYLNYEQAVQDWMQVLHLLPDPADPLHRKAKDYMEQARLKLQR